GCWPFTLMILSICSLFRLRRIGWRTDGDRVRRSWRGRRGAGPRGRRAAPAGRDRRRRRAQHAADLASADGPVVPAGQFAVLGDNAESSLDSRSFGYIPAERLLGVMLRPV